jgi:hypothetical protein
LAMLDYIIYPISWQGNGDYGILYFGNLRTCLPAGR